MKKTVVLLCVLLLVLLTGCGEKIVTNLNQGSMPDYIDFDSQSKYTESLYKLKDTSLSDEEKVRKIFETMTYFSGEKFDLNVNEKVLNITYNVPLRSDFRDVKELKRNSTQTIITAFSLIYDADKISININDDYGSFFETSLSREKMYENPSVKDLKGMDYFTEETVKKASGKRNTFDDYLVKVLGISCKKSDKDIFFEEINKKLSDDEILIYDDVEFYNIKLQENSLINGIDISKIAKDKKLELSRYMGKNLDVVMCRVSDFKNSIEYKKVFVFSGSAIIIDSKI